MPIYEYRRPNGTTFEVMQRMTDDPLTQDPETGVPLERVFHPVAVHFKGKGFYNTDYGTKRRNRELRESAESGADKYEAKQAEKKAEKEKAAAVVFFRFVFDGAAKPRPRRRPATRSRRQEVQA